MNKFFSVSIALVCSITISSALINIDDIKEKKELNSVYYSQKSKTENQSKELALGFKIDEIQSNKGFLIELKNVLGMQNGFILVGEDQQFSVYSKKNKKDFLVVLEDQQVSSPLAKNFAKNMGKQKAHNRFNNDIILTKNSKQLPLVYVKDLNIVDGKELFIGMFKIKKIYKVNLTDSIISNLLKFTNNNSFFSLNYDSNPILKRFLSKDHLIFTVAESLLLGFLFAEITGGFSYLKYFINKNIDPSLGKFDWKPVRQKFISGTIKGFVLSEILWACETYFQNKTEKGFFNINDLSLVQKHFPVIFNLNSLLTNKINLGLSNINVAKIDFVDDRELIQDKKELFKEESGEIISLYEILIGSDGNSIKNKDGQVARLVVTKY